MSPEATFFIDLYGTVPIVDYSVVHISGIAHFDGTLWLIPQDGYEPADGDSFALFDWLSYGGVKDHDFQFYDLPALNPGLYWHTEDFPATGTLFVNATPAPEPTSAALLLGGGALLALRRRRSPAGA